MNELFILLIYQFGLGGVGGIITGFVTKKLTKLIALLIGLFILSLLFYPLKA